MKPLRRFFALAFASACQALACQHPDVPARTLPVPATSERQPIVATFVDVGPAPLDIAISRCEEIAIATMTGAVEAEGDALNPGDVLLVEGKGKLDLRGAGVAVIAAVRERPCKEGGEPRKRVVRASVASELTWAGGAMHAHLDLEKDASPYAYVGRLEGSAPVAEHAHADTWEVLCALEAAGTFTLDGAAQRLGSRTCVSVPPNVKHSWKPDEGTKLVAVQFYDPPGPEQRFKKLAQDQQEGGKAADAGR
jgi:mannose-6-phosphate isomerase-like protein (cupin superfamily)